MALAHARYRQTSANKSNGGVWTTGSNLWYNTAQKVSPLVTKTDSGTPSVTKFTLNANGVWLVNVSHAFSVSSNIYLRGATGSNAFGGMVGGTYINLVVCREFNFAQELWVMWQGADATMAQGDAEVNYISFTFMGAI